MSSSGPGRAVKRTHGGGESRERQKVGKTHVPPKWAQTRATGAGRALPPVLSLGSGLLCPPETPLGRREGSSCLCFWGQTRHGNATEADRVPNIYDRLTRCLFHCLWHHRHKRTLDESIIIILFNTWKKKRPRGMNSPNSQSQKVRGIPPQAAKVQSSHPNYSRAEVPDYPGHRGKRTRAFQGR